MELLKKKKKKKKKKKHYINMENYFILRINYNNKMNYLKIIFMITKHFQIKRINWKITLWIYIFNNINYNRTRYYSESTIPISDSRPVLLMPSQILSILNSVFIKILMVGTPKNVTDLCNLIQFFNAICICF